MSKYRRDLSAADQHLGPYVTRNVKAYRSSVQSNGASDPLPIRKPSHPSLVGASTHGAPHRTVATQTKPNPISVGVTANIDRRTSTKLKRGQLTVDGRIDLHGLTLDQAHAGLNAFLKGAYNRQARCVLVVTGKGRPGERTGKIRGELLHWLNQPALRPLVLAVTEAQIRDGGAGAFYVLLKRNRSEGLR